MQQFANLTNPARAHRSLFLLLELDAFQQAGDKANTFHP
jgi:hypothetical protein